MPAPRVEGLDETLAYLKLFDEQLYKDINKELQREMYKLVKVARSLTPTTSPMTNWNTDGGGKWGNEIGFDPAKARSRIRSQSKAVRPKNSTTKERVYLLLNDRAGAIYETAGRKTQGKTPQGRQFITNIENYSGMVVIGKQGRVAWKAVNENRKEVIAGVAVIVNKYQEIINRKLAR